MKSTQLTIGSSHFKKNGNWASTESEKTNKCKCKDKAPQTLDRKEK